MNSGMATTAGDHADSAPSGIPPPPCEGHGNTQACPTCMYTNYQREVVFKKIVSRSDIQGRGSYRLYIPRPHAARFCAPANESEVITFSDAQTNRLCPMRFRTSGRNAYLARGWIQFAREKQLGQGDTITLDEVRCGQRTRFFMIGSLAKTVFRFSDLQ